MDNFEASFEEQFNVIQSQPADIQEDLEHLPEALKQKLDAKHYCFKYPEPMLGEDHPHDILHALTWDQQSRKRAAAIMTDYCDEQATRDSLLLGCNDEDQLAAARILAILVCAEESAINIFNHECKRLSEEEVQYNLQAMEEIESEERVHNWLIQKARAYYPEPEDINDIRRRTRRLFMRVASRDLPTHFARITGLDSGVCICLTAVLGSKKVNAITGFDRLIRHIRRDESTHVKKSRDHAIGMGFDANTFHECYDLTRAGMVKMLEPIASSFEQLQVDPDRLFKRLMRFQGNRMPDAVELN